MTQEELQNQIATLQQRRDQLEKDARDHEMKARDCRAQLSECKSDLASLSTAATNAAVATAAQQAAKDVAHSKADIASLLAAMKKGEEVVQAKSQRLDDLAEKMEKLIIRCENALQELHGREEQPVSAE